MVLNCNNISKLFNGEYILKNITFNLNENEKIGIVGVNGAGKSTLFKIITRELNTDEGDVVIPKHINIGYFSQVLNINEQNTLFNELLTIFKEVIEKENTLIELESKMSCISGEELEKIINEYTKISNYLNENNLLSYNSKIKGVLKGLGFEENDFHQNISTFSGGQKTRIALAKILLREPELLLLDEPTNHLDISSIQWLENYLKSYKGAILIISHDRFFLDKIIGKVIEIENKTCKIFQGNYSSYSEKKQILREVMIKQYLDQQKEISKQEESIKKLKAFNREKFVKRAESKQKQLNKLEKIEKPENLPKIIKFSLNPKKESGNDVLSVKNLKKSYDEVLFENISFEIKKGEKVALIGANGIGKTTLIKMIIQNINQKNQSINIGSNVVIGYYDQEQKNLDFNKTIFQEISDTYPSLKNEEIRNTLAIFNFTGDEVFKNISSLSGGEKGRVALAKITLSNANFLILDEPTNHLDINSKEVLENAIKSYSGTCLYISHDRFFINNTSTKILELTKNNMNIYLGDYNYYLERVQALKENLEPQKNIQKETTIKLDWKSQKEAQAEARKRENNIKKLEQQIEKIEIEIEEKEKLLISEEVFTDAGKSNEIFKEKSTLEENLMLLYEQWENMQ